MGAGFFVFIVIARVLGSETLGQLALLMAFIQIAGNLADLGTTAALAKDLPQAKNKNHQIYFGNYLILRFLLAGAVMIIAIPTAYAVDSNLLEPLLIACVTIPFIGMRYFEIVFQVFERPQYTLYSSIVLASLQLSISLTLLLVFDQGLVGYMYGFAVTQISYGVVTTALAFRLVAPKFEFRYALLRATIVLATPMGLWALFNTISTRADIFMLDYWRTSQEVGIYNAAYRLLDLAVVVAATTALPLVSVLSKSFSQDPKATNIICAKIIEWTAILTFPIPIILIFAAEPLVVMLYGEAYIESAALLQIFAWLFMFLSCMYIGSSINLAAGNIRHAWWNAGIAACLNVAANFILIPKYGAMGAAASTAVSTLFTLIVTLVYVRINIGSLFIWHRWARIFGAAGILYIYLTLMADKPIILMVITGSIVYLVVTGTFRLLPLEYFVTLYHYMRKNKVGR
jgi:O-antigen/teichoic acid export membrane protein